MNLTDFLETTIDQTNFYRENMNMDTRIIEMKRKEQGAALVIGLLLLAVTTIVGIAGLSGSNMQERISANQKQQTEAMMAAETGLSEAINWFNNESGWCSDNDPDCVDDLKSEIKDDATTFSSAFADWLVNDLFFEGSKKVTITTEGVINNADTKRYVQAVYMKGTTPDPYGPYTCFGLGCNVEIGGSAHVDSDIHPLPAAYPCTGSNCTNTTALSPSGSSTGMYLPDNGTVCKTTGSPSDRCDPDTMGSYINGNIVQSYAHPPVQQVDADGNPVVDGSGNPVMVTPVDGDGEPLEWHSNEWVDYVGTLDSLGVDGSYDSANSPSGTIGDRNDPKYIEVTGSVQINSNTNVVGVIVVRAGGQLRTNGTFHLEGILILEPGATIDFGSGNTSIYGAIIGMQGSNVVLDADFTGNITLNYSEAAFLNLAKLSGNSVINWKEVIPSA